MKLSDLARQTSVAAMGGIETDGSGKAPCPTHIRNTFLFPGNTVLGERAAAHVVAYDGTEKGEATSLAIAFPILMDGNVNWAYSPLEDMKSDPSICSIGRSFGRRE